MVIWQLNLRHLAAIAKISRLGTISAAAEAVSLTQPAITQALNRFEELVGEPLFERRHDGMAPLSAAEMLVPRIEAALAHIASPHVTMARLRSLVALADAGSYAGASLRTGLSQPSLHRAVNDLSLALRKPLVQRQGRRLTLTEAGRLLARSFRLARVELETGLSEIEALRGRETRSIAIGAMPLSRARILPAAITRFHRRHPRVKLVVVEGSRSELLEPLCNGALDFMVGALREPLLEPDLVQKHLFVDVPVVIGRKGHPLCGKAPGPAELACYPWTIPAVGAPLRDGFERYFRDAGLGVPEVPIESGSMMIIRQILLDSDFLTLLSPDQVAVELQAGWLAQIVGLPPALGRSIGVTTRLSWQPTRVQGEFLADLADVARAGG